MQTTNADTKTVTAEQAQNISETEVFDVLANDRRRLVLALLDDFGPLKQATVIDRVTARENDAPGHDYSGQERKRVYVSLVQCHGPKLEEAGVVTIDGEEWSLGPNARPVLRHLRTPTFRDTVSAKVNQWL